MKHFRRLSLIFTLMVLSSVICRAGDSIHTQSIHGMYDAKTLTVTNSNKVGVTDFVTYTITGANKNSKFGAYGGVICICLLENGDFVTTTKITNLKRVWFTYYPSTDYLSGAYPSMQILVSKDSTAWSNIATSATHSKGSADVLLPSAGDYFVRIKNTGSSKPMYINVMNYTTQHCNCFRYQP